MVKHNKLLNTKIKLFAPWLDHIEGQLLAQGDAIEIAGEEVKADATPFVEKVRKALKYS